CARHGAPATAAVIGFDSW
nr:immunoglobulin heavy chain junction region [Macaca mulatta]MOY18746.1 immunoglobulin heavy chain junction region [Macaca mulatta]